MEGKVNAYVFIARDDDEYSKYSFADNKGWEVGDREIKEQYEWQWRFCPESRVLRIIMHKGGLDWDKLKPKGELAAEMDKLSHPPKNDSKGYRIAGRNVKNWVGNIFSKQEEEHSLCTIVDKLLRKFICHGNRMRLGQCCIFLHWGEANAEEMFFYEDKIQGYLPNIWRMFSIGTHRNNVFNVDRDPIIVPYEKSVLQELEYKINYARKLEPVKNAMTTYVQNQTSNDEDKARLEECFSTDTFREKLRSVAKEAKFAWLLDWNLFRCLMAVRDNDHDQVKRIIVEMMEPKEYDLHTKSFFSQLLSEGILG